MLSSAGTLLEVWGDPIAHSRSPQLHAAAYRVLGLDWTYGRRRVSEAAFAGEFAGVTEDWRGLSLTMPLKGVAWRTAEWRDRRAELTRAVNTLLLAADGPRGFNTDIGGIVRALQDERIDGATDARIIGAGATALSALVALGEHGADRVEVVARRAAAVQPLVEVGAALGIDVVGVSFDAPGYSAVPVTIATLPGETAVADAATDALAAGGGLLLDVVYGHWPTAFARAWARADQRAVSGIGMLLHQALLQVRIFVTGDPDTAVDDEAAVLAAMRLAVMGD
jgi:shikimate dehydrogenase